MYISTPQNETCRYKSNKTCTRSVSGILHNSVNKIKELNKWSYIACSWIRRLNIVNMSVHPNLTYRFSTIPIKIPASYFMPIDKLILKERWRPQIANTVPKKNEAGVLIPPDFTICYKTAVIKIVWYWWKSRQRDQGNWIESRCRPHKYSQLIIDKGAKAIQWVKGCLFNKWYGTTGHLLAKKIKYIPYTLHKN